MYIFNEKAIIYLFFMRLKKHPKRKKKEGHEKNGVRQERREWRKSRYDRGDEKSGSGWKGQGKLSSEPF